MKKFLSIISICFAVSLTSCSSEKDIDVDTNGGKGLEFVHFDGSSDAWLVSETDASYTFNVPLYQTFKSSAPQTYDIMLGEGTTEGAEGELFTLVSDKVTIPAGEYEGNIQIVVKYDKIPYPDNTGFAIQLVCDTDKINPSYGRAYMISVKSDKIVMDWEWLVGKWTAQDYCYYDGTTEEAYPINITKKDESTAILTNLCGTGADLSGTVDFDNHTITLPGNIEMIHLDNYETDLYFVAVNPSTDYDVYEDLSTPVVATFSPAGIEIDNWDFLMVGGPYDGYTFGGGYCTSLVK